MAGHGVFSPVTALGRALGESNLVVEQGNSRFQSSRGRGNPSTFLSHSADLEHQNIPSQRVVGDWIMFASHDFDIDSDRDISCFYPGLYQ